MKRGLKFILTHVTAAFLTWGAIFCYVLPKRNYDQIDPIVGRESRFTERLELSANSDARKSPIALVSRFLWLHSGGDEPALAKINLYGFDVNVTYYFVTGHDSNGHPTISITEKVHSVMGFNDPPIKTYPTASYVERIRIEPSGELGETLEPKDDGNDCNYIVRFMDNNDKPIDVGHWW